MAAVGEPVCGEWTAQGVNGSSSAVVTAGDGGRFRVTRLGHSGGQPVVLIPGTFDNRRLYLWPDGGGLAAVLAQAGFEVWVVERRGVGGVEPVAEVRTGWEEALRHDLPAVQRLVAKTTAAPAFWVGHSFGGVLVARAVAETLDRDQVAGLILVSAAVEVALLTNPIVRTVLSSRRWGTVFPARALRLGPEDESSAALADAIDWAGAERRHSCISAMLGAVAEVPILAATSPLDLIAPPGSCRRLARACGSRDLRVQSLSRRNGFAINHTHASPLLHPRAAEDVFPFLRDWLITRSATQNALTATEPADTAPRRHRLEFTVDLDADIDTVFDLLTDRWADLWPVRQHRARDGLVPAIPNGRGSVRAQRALGIWPIREQITAHQRPHLIEYRTISGPVRRHRGRLLLTTTSATTRLDYRIEFDTPFWIPGALLTAALRHTWSRYSLPHLHTLCTQRSGFAATLSRGQCRR